MRFATTARALLLMLLPASLSRLLAGSAFRIDRSARIGFSWVELDGLELGPGARIGHFNIIRSQSLKAAPEAYVGYGNVIRGPFSVELGPNAGIGNRNRIVRSPSNADTRSHLSLGIWAKITSDHYVDLTSSISIGDYSTIAGSGCQLWTHGYVHAETGLDRYRIDGGISIGSNVYVGAMCFISMGVTLGDGVIVGGGTSVASDLLEPGLYVSSPVRKLPRPRDPAGRDDLERVPSASGDIVYRKKAAAPWPSKE